MGPTAQAIIARVVTETPRSLTAQRHTIPPQVEAAVLTALEKLPADRFATAAEFAAALADTRFTPRGTQSIAAVRGPAPRSSRLGMAGWAVAVVAVVTALWGWMKPAPVRPVLRFAMTLPQGQELSNARGTRIAISPDGSRLVYNGPGAEGNQLWIRNRSQLTATPIPGTERGIEPTFSPDGQQVAYAMDGTGAIKVVTLTGAPPITIVDSAVGADGVTWGSDGYVYYDGLTGGGTTGLMRVRSSGGTREQMTTVDTAKGEVDHYWPQALPDGRGVLFTIQKRSSREASDVAVLDLKTGQYHTLVRGLTARYAATGHLIYVTDGGDLMAAPFDLKRLAVTGEAVALTNGVAGRPFGAVDLTLSDNGTLMYEQGAQVTGSAEIVYVARDGRPTLVDSGWAGNFQTLALSPDGKQLAVSMLEGREHQTWIKQLPDGPLSKLTFDGTENYRPSWTPDGRSVGFVSNQSGQSKFWMKRADGSAPAELVASQPDRTVNEGFWSADGKWVVYRTTPRDIFARGLGADTATIPLLDTKFEEMDAALSPDGRWLAYTSSESGQVEVYVRPFPATGTAKWQVSTNGGFEPHWSHNGRELFYDSSDNLMTAIEVIPGAVFTTGKRQKLFSVLPFAGGIRSWDLTPDDTRFAMIRIGAGNQNANQLIVVENLFADLKKQ